MNIWKRFLSLALVFALVLSMGPIIPFVQANAETVPANEEIYTNDGKELLSSGWSWTGSKVDSDRGIRFNTTSFYTQQAVENGWISAEFVLPTISAEQADLNKATYKSGDGSSNPMFGVRFRNAASTGITVQADLLLNRASDNTTFRLYAVANAYGTGAVNYHSTTGNLNCVWDETKPVTISLYKIGNFYVAKLVQNGTVLSELAVTVNASKAADTHYMAKTDTTWQAGINGSLAKLWTTNDAGEVVLEDDNYGYARNIVVGSINKLVSVAVDTNLVTLPVHKEYANSPSTVLARNAYQVGETVALTVAEGYDAYANGKKIEDPTAFVIPDAETVTITAVQKERELYSATPEDFDNTAKSYYSYSEVFNNGYVEADLTLIPANGAISNTALMYVHSPNNKSGAGGAKEVAIRWNVKADTTKTGYTHYAQATLLLRDTGEDGYDLDKEHGGNVAVSSTQKIYFNTTTTMKVRLQAVGNYITLTVDDEVVLETTLNPEYAFTTNAGYFGLSFSAAAAGSAAFSNIKIQELRTYSVLINADGVQADPVEDLAVKILVAAGREGLVATNRSHTMYLPGETVTLVVDTEVMDVSTLKVNGGAVEVTGSNGTYTFTMPEEDVTVTCDKLVMYAITESLDDLSVDKTEAPAGATVTITLGETKLDAATLKVNGGAVAVSGSEGTYTFTMPAGDVTITCEEKQLDPVESLTKYQPTTDVYNWSYTASTWKDGVVEVDIQFPTITTEQLAALRKACTQNTGASSNPNYAVTIKTGSYSVTGTLFLWRNGSNSQLRFDTTAGLCAATNQRYLSANLDELFINGTLATFRIAKVGNFIQVQILDGNTVVADFSYTVPDGTAFTDATAWTVSVASTAGKVFTTCDPDTNELSNQLNTNAPIKRAEVKRINKTVTITTEGTNASLPATYSVVDKATALARNAYYVGETIALNVADGYDAFANGELIEDPENFVIPNAETVIITVAEQEIPPVSATYADGVYEAGKWTTTDTSAYVNEPFANGYIEVEFAISGTISNAANLFVRSPKDAKGALQGREDEIMLRWTVAADTSKAGYTHKATSALVIRDNTAPGYVLASSNAIHGTAKTVYLNIQEGAPAVLKVKMEVVGNLLRIYVNGVLHQEATFDPQYPIASQAGYFGYYGLGANVTVDAATVQEVKAYTVTVPENVVADETAHLIKPYSTYGSAFGRSTYVAGETVTLVVDTAVMDASTLKVNGGAVEVTGSNGTYTFTMPEEDVTVTCDKLVMYTITENLDDLSVDKTEAPAGATVTITLEETKLDVSTLKVNGGAVAVSGSNGTYTFTMPAEAVTITCNEKQLAVNEELFNNDGKSDISTGWTSTLTSDGNAVNGAGTAYYSTTMSDGWIKATVQMPNLTDDQKTTLSGGTSTNTQMFYMFYVKDGTTTIQAGIYYHRFNGYIIRVRSTGGDFNGTNLTGEHVANLNGKTVEMMLRKVGNYLEISIVATDGSYSKTISAAFPGTTLSDNVQFGIYNTIPSLDNTIKANWTNIQVGRMNKTVAVTVNTDLVTLPAALDFAAKPSTEVARTAYQVGEVIALGVDPTADATTLKANGVVIADHEAFVIPNAEAVTITCNKLTLDDNQTLYSYNGTGALPTDLWSAAGTLTDNKLTTVTSKYNTAIEDGWISATVKMPETLPTGSTQVVIEAIEPTSKLEIEFGFLGGANYRAYIRRGNVDTNYAVSSNSFMVFPVGQTSVGDVAGKEVTLSMRKVGNYFELHIYCEGVIDATHGFTMGDITAADGTVLAAIDDAKFNFGVSFPAFGGMTVESIEIGRMNKVATVTVDADSKDLIKVPQFKDPKDTKVLRDRTAYQIGEIIALVVSGNAKDVKANGVAVANTAAFEITENVVLTATLDKDPYYVATDAIVQYNPAGTAGGTKEWKLLAADYTATIATGYVVSTNITVYTQQKANGTVMNNYPWHGVEVNAVDFRVRPSSDATNSYYIGIRFGGAWVASDDGVVAAAAMTSKVTIPGEKLVGADNEVTYNQAIKVENGVYTLYINGCAVCTYTNATATKGNVRVWSAKNGTLEGDNGNTWGFKVEYADMRIDRIGSVEEVTFGQKQLALDEDLAMDFYIALPTDTTATTATITLGGKEIAVVDLADAERKPLVDSNMVGWYSWYVVTANVPVKEANSNIVVTLNDGSSKTYSVKEYLDYIMNSDAPEYAAAKATAQSLLDYSATAASYFADRTGAAELPAELAARLENVTIADTYKPTRAGVNEYVSLYGCSLEAVEKANICIYFKVGATYEWSNETVTVKIGDTAVDNFVVEDAGNGYKRVKITGIHAADLDVVYTVSVAGLTINYSGLSYAYTALNSTTSANLQTMAKALYSYWAAAQAMN